jgi:renalase
MSEVAIIGAGVCGLAAAHALREAGLRVTLYEGEAEVGGRATTRARAGFLYDPGAQYIHGNHPPSDALICRRFFSEELVAIRKPVWVFDAQHVIREGDPVQNAVPRWTYRRGLITLPRLMAAELSVQRQCRIARLEYGADGWRLWDEAGRAVGTAERLLVTAPAPRAAALIAASRLSGLPPTWQAEVVARLRQAAYHPLISLTLAWHRRLLGDWPYYALVNSDKAHPISWLAREDEKAPERAPADCALLIVQMAPRYSREHWEVPASMLVQQVVPLVAELLSVPLTEPLFSDVVRWPYALPVTPLDGSALQDLTRPYGLLCAGDAFVGGRVHLALAQGLEAARRLLS